MTNIAYSFFETARVNRVFLLCFYKAAPKQYFDVFTDAIIQSNYAGRTDIPPIKYYNYAAKA